MIFTDVHLSEYIVDIWNTYIYIQGYTHLYLDTYKSMQVHLRTCTHVVVIIG